MNGEITITFHEGKANIEVKGVKGKSCKDVTADLERKLGKVTTTKNTREYQEQEGRHGQRVDNRS